MLTPEQINQIHRLHWAEKWSVRKIARHLHLGRRTIAKYLTKPAQTAAPRLRASKLDSFKSMIGEWLQQDPKVSAEVILQRIRPLGYQGGHRILREYLHAVRMFGYCSPLVTNCQRRPVCTIGRFYGVQSALLAKLWVQYPELSVTAITQNH